jgi:membrane carboxypeptidase/penicillin-binding protein PbpC
MVALSVNNVVPAGANQTSNQNTVFVADKAAKGGATVTIVSSDTASNNVWFAPAGTTLFTESATMTKASGTTRTITAPATAGTYKLYVIDAAGNSVALSVNNVVPAGANQTLLLAVSELAMGTGAPPLAALSATKTVFWLVNNVWFAPAGTTSFSESATMTKASGTATTITAPATAGDYKLYVIDAAGNRSDGACRSKPNIITGSV